MPRLLRILLFVAVLALASIGEARASVCDARHNDRLRGNDIAQQERQHAILSDAPVGYRLVPARPERVTPSGDTKTQPTHGRFLSAFYTFNTHPFYGRACSCMLLEQAARCASGAKTFIALRHIIR